MGGPEEPWYRTGRARRIATAVVLGVGALALAWPLMAVEWLPFVDYPQHLGTVAAIHGQGDPTWSEYFVVEYSRSQYLLLYVISDVLAYPLGVEGAARLTAVLSIAGLPLALALYLRESGRDPMLGAVAVAVSLHVYVFWGFLNYAAGMAVGLVALAAFARLCRQPTSRNAVLFGLGALLTFYTHAQSYLWLAVACLVTLLAIAPKVGRAEALGVLWRGAAGAAPSVLGMLYWLNASDVVEHGEAGARSGHAAQVTEDPAQFAEVADTVRGWLGHSFETFSDGAGIWIAAAFFAVVMVIVALRGVSEVAARRDVPERAKGDGSAAAKKERKGKGSKRGGKGKGSKREGEEPKPDEGSGVSGAVSWRRVSAWARGEPAPHVASLGPEATLIATFALYLFAPVSYRLIQPISHRFLPLALALLVALGPRGRIGDRVRLGLGALLVALSLFVGVAHSERFALLDEEMGELDAALEHTEPGKRMLGLIHDQRSEVVPFATYLHAHQYYQARVGGMAAFSFVEFPKSPVQWRPGHAPPPFPPRFEWTPQRYDHGTWGDAFDYWLVRHPPGRPPRNPLRLRPNAPGAPEPVFESSRWTLYARPE